MGLLDFFSFKRPALPASSTSGEPEWVKAQVLSGDRFTPAGFRTGFLSSNQRAPRRGTPELLAAYDSTPMLRATVAKIAGNAARVPGRLYARKKKGTGKGSSSKAEYVEDLQTRNLSHEWKIKEIKTLRNQDEMELVGPEHPLLKLLERPNEHMRGRALMFLTFAWIDLVGDAFWTFNTDRAGKPTSLFAIPPQWVRSLPTRQRPFFEVKIENETFEIPVGNMIHFKDPSLLNPYGRGSGVGHALADELDTDENASKHLSSFFYNRAMPDMIVSVEGADEEMLLATKAKFEDQHLGLGNAYRSAFMNGSVSVERLDTSFKDMDLVSIRKFVGREVVVQAFGISPEMLGILDNSNRATVFEARAMFAENVLLPRLDLVESVLQDLACLFDERLLFAFDDPKPDDLKHVLEVGKARPNILTENEWRVLAGQDPVPGGDVYRLENGSVVTRLDHGLEGGDESPAVSGVQDLALNGAQISSLLVVIQAVAAGTLPKATALILLGEAFPSIAAESIAGMLAPIEEGSMPELGELAADPTADPAPLPADDEKAWRSWGARSVLKGLRGVRYLAPVPVPAADPDAT